MCVSLELFFYLFLNKRERVFEANEVQPPGSDLILRFSDLSRSYFIVLKIHLQLNLYTRMGESQIWQKLEKKVCKDGVKDTKA
jgi:hypothetical protein